MSEDLLVLNLINQISENPFENVMNYAQKLSSLPPLAVYAIKQNLRYAQNHGRTETIERETHIQRYLGNTLDYREGVKAFIEKRPAQFKGQ
jgi:enoyl-CoA hydratase/carnithine racemase